MKNFGKVTEPKKHGFSNECLLVYDSLLKVIIFSFDWSKPLMTGCN